MQFSRNWKSFALLSAAAAADVSAAEDESEASKQAVRGTPANDGSVQKVFLGFQPFPGGNPPGDRDTAARLQKRAERFSLPPKDSKKAARAARFGLPEKLVPSKGTSVVSKTNVEVEVLKKRAERFGMKVSSVSKKVEEDEKLKKRKERFGIVATAASVKPYDLEAKKRKRADRFGIRTKLFKKNVYSSY